MEAAVYDNHSSYARIHQNQHHHYPHTSPVPVPGAHVHPRAPARVEGDGHYLALHTQPSSPYTSRSAPLSDATEHDDAVFSSYQAASTQASVISKLDMDTPGPPPPPPPRREAGLHLSQPPPPPPPSHIQHPAVISQPFPPMLYHHPPRLYPPPPPPPPSNVTFHSTPVLNLRPPPNYQHNTIPPQQQPPQEISPAPPPRMTVGSAPEASRNAPKWPQSPGLRAPKGFIDLRPPHSTRRLAAPKIPTRPDLLDTTSTSHSSTYTIPRLIDDVASLDSISDEDSLALRNSRQFPPLLPTASSLNLQGGNRKTSMTNRITTWISQYERDRAPKDRPDMDVSLDPLLETLGGDKSHVSKGSAPSEDTLEMLWTKLKDQRVRLNDIKGRMSKKRKKLRDLRRKRDDADNAFMGVIRPMFVAQQGRVGAAPGTLERRLADLQRLRNEYQASENDYEDLEVTLDEEEETLNKLEIRFFSLLAVGQTIPLQRPPEDDSKDDQNNIMNMPNDLMGISPDGPPEDLHPLYVDLMAAVGDLENAKEELDELLFLKEQHEDELKMKAAAGMELNEAEIEFFDEFPLEEEQMRSSVVGLEKQVASLRKLCEEKGAMQKHLSARVAYLLYPENGYEDIELDDKPIILRSRSSLAHPTFPVLLSQPEHIMSQGSPLTPRGALKAAAALPKTDPTKISRMQLASKEYAIDQLMVDHQEGGKGDFINRWLLHQLRLSPVNALLLHTTFTRSRALKIRDLGRWQSDVLRYWWNDQGADLPDEMMNLVTSEHSNDGSRVGTHQLSRAVTYTPGMHGGRQSHITASSVAHSAWE
ncbi:hypothetical protein FSARC_7291 [Fusarium sarcochroum]|uniref:Uncharacterized protein n=1 Tax=Fusarium sarcochroum TaxID=1208366 RepID=A0A8H4TVQ0_9HYPO|nr:hypothetical protein FSARC_7291 [Fusarium sarcochroum]